MATHRPAPPGPVETDVRSLASDFHQHVRRDSNPRQPVLETGALPTELRTYEKRISGPAETDRSSLLYLAPPLYCDCR